MLNKALKTVRQYHRLNQIELASNLSLSPSYISEIEKGKKEPSLDVLQKYADFFKIPLSSLIVFSETLDGEHSEKSVKSFLSKKMLGILEWLTNQDDALQKKLRDQ
ncbi:MULTISPECIES: helix-turn-helix domain-containing protein [Alcaligenes]|uniref:helix-turn-helix domain-containing protein n=1 Tax=Alcaligenes TaxID=507 RepID=UPI0002AA79AA|nr:MULTISPECIES: helix-turn-helix transcriptional regulator [Alcaligenes]EKU28239.1 XRE family transcriptional regulator [Alcaligenes sp. HPC1271]ERI33258.1 hypothetical protein N879_09740 [Alcaligenes sp. EGD-AK7]OQV31608.1 transcriptional regulator [Alcaligenes phenolicus]